MSSREADAQVGVSLKGSRKEAGRKPEGSRLGNISQRLSRGSDLGSHFDDVDISLPGDNLLTTEQLCCFPRNATTIDKLHHVNE